MERNSTSGQIEKTEGTEDKRRFCTNCGAILEHGQLFCGSCGQELVLAEPTGVNITPESIGVGNHTPPKKKTPVIIAGIAGGVLILVILFIIFGGGTKDFNDMFSDISGETWCDISEDGSWMTIDTNPGDITDSVDNSAYYEIQTINTELGFSGALFEKMGETRALDGRQTEENDKYRVSWSYHPDNGMEVLYEIID